MFHHCTIAGVLWCVIVSPCSGGAPATDDDDSDDAGLDCDTESDDNSDYDANDDDDDDDVDDGRGTVPAVNMMSNHNTREEATVVGVGVEDTTTHPPHSDVPSVSVSVVQCDVCGVMCSSVDTLRVHMTRMHHHDSNTPTVTLPLPT